MSQRVSVSSADFIRNIGHWQNEALRRPISITHHGRERLVLAAPDEFNSGAAAEAAVHSSLQELRADADAVLENLEDGFLAFDTSLRVTRSNTIAEAFIGRSRDLLHGVFAIDFMPQPVGLVLHERLQRVMRTRKHETFEAAFDNRHIVVRVFPLSGGVAALFGNITEQCEQRLRLEEANALVAAMHSHPYAAAIRLDASARIRSIDDDFCHWSGFHRDDMIGQRFVDLVPGCQRREVGDLIENAMRESKQQKIDLTLLSRQGQELAGVLAVAPILTEFIAHGVMAIWVSAVGSVNAHQAA
jgi:PAS domain S-box-containing protein